MMVISLMRKKHHHFFAVNYFSYIELRAAIADNNPTATDVRSVRPKRRQQKDFYCEVPYINLYSKSYLQTAQTFNYIPL